MLRGKCYYALLLGVIILSVPVFAAGTLKVNNTLGYSVAVEVDGVYSAHIPGGEHFYKDLSAGTHTVRIFNESSSSTYSPGITDGNVTTINHGSWQGGGGSSTPVNQLKVNNNLSYSVNVDVSGVYRAHVVGGEHWYLGLVPGSYTVRVYNESNSRTYYISYSSGNYTLNHNDWGTSDVKDIQYDIAGFELHQNYPNPFNPATEISFTLNENAHVRLSIYNSVGQTVRTLSDAQYNSGLHRITWDGTDALGKPLEAGTYLYQLQVTSMERDQTSHSIVRKMLLVK